HLLPVEPHKIYRIEHERRISAVSHGYRDDLPREREQQSRAFDHHGRMHVFLRNIPDPEHAGIDQLEGEQHLTARFRFALELELDLDIGLGQRRSIHIDLDIDRGLLRPPLERVRCIGILEGEILGVLRQNIDLRLLAGAAVSDGGHWSSLTRDAEPPLSGGVANIGGTEGQGWPPDAASASAGSSGTRRHWLGSSSKTVSSLRRAPPRPRNSVATIHRCRLGTSSRIPARSVKNPGASSRIPATTVKTPGARSSSVPASVAPRNRARATPPAPRIRATPPSDVSSITPRAASTPIADATARNTANSAIGRKASPTRTQRIRTIGLVLMAEVGAARRIV